MSFQSHEIQTISHHPVLFAVNSDDVVHYVNQHVRTYKICSVIRYAPLLKDIARCLTIKSSIMDYSQHSALADLKDEDVKRFTLKGKEKYAKVVSIFDGDTLDLAFYNEMSRFVRYKCRMSGYDAPEMDEENGKLARDYLAHLCMGGNDVKPVVFKNGNSVLSKDQLQTKLDKNKRLVSAQFGREGKYGRPVVTLYQTSSRGNPPNILLEKSINDMMTKFVHELDSLDLQVTSEASSDERMTKLAHSVFGTSSDSDTS